MKKHSILEEDDPFEKFLKIQASDDDVKDVQIGRQKIVFDLGQSEMPQEKFFKDLELWIGEVEIALQSEDYGRSMASVEVHLERMSISEADIDFHQDCINEMNQKIYERIKSISEKYDNVEKMAAIRREKLNILANVYQFFRDVENEKSWIEDKKLLVSSDDYGHDLLEVRNLRRKHHRIHTESNATAPAKAPTTTPIPPRKSARL